MGINYFKNIDQRKRIAIKAYSSFAIIALISYFIIYPSISDIKEIKEEIQRQRIDLENRYNKVKNLKKLSINMRQFESQSANLDRPLINKDQALGFITTLEKIAGANNIEQKISMASFSDAKLTDKHYKKIPLQIETSGSFNDQMKYLTDIEALSYYVNVKTIEFSLKNDKDDSKENPNNIINAIINADTYWQ